MGISEHVALSCNPEPAPGVDRDPRPSRPAPPTFIRRPVGEDADASEISARRRRPRLARGVTNSTPRDFDGVCIAISFTSVPLAPKDPGFQKGGEGWEPAPGVDRDPRPSRPGLLLHSSAGPSARMRTRAKSRRGGGGHAWHAA
ncbi:hypothetical protein CRUP_002161 [Coryphaenoides rupestris]|nr:hypothetical protein CRUP_002161 [Coryphaenoides rupestris]